MRRLLLFLAPALLLLFAFRTTADHLVSGTVRDDKGNPIVAAAVKVKGSKTGTQTDVSGHYTLLMRRIKGQWKIVADHSS